MSLQDPDLQRPVTKGDVRTLVLPSGGTVEIPMPKSKQKGIIINPPSRGLADFAGGGSSMMPVVIGVLVGAAIGGAIVWAITRHRALPQGG
jgi:hypothetical protein